MQQYSRLNRYGRQIASAALLGAALCLAGCKCIHANAPTSLESIGTGGPRIGLMTGTFSPPHMGHRAVVEHAIQEMHLTRMFLVVNVNPSAKPDAVRFEMRRQMAHLAFDKIPLASVADDELEVAQSKSGMDEVYASLRRRVGSGELFHFMGSDSYESLMAKASHVDFGDVTLVPVVRNGRRPSPPPEGVRMLVLPEPLPVGLSSTKIRGELADGKPPSRDELDPDVLTYIQAQGLYQGSAKDPSGGDGE